MNHGLEIKDLDGYKSTLAHRDQYVVGRTDANGSLMILYQLSPPQVRAIDSPLMGQSGGFIVFCSHPDPQGRNLKDLAEVWRHSSQHHEATLKLYSLKDLGIVENP